MSSSGRALRERLFEAEREAFAKTCPSDAGLVACPLCLQRFTFEDAIESRLTVEHVPPKSIGGRPLLLTCRSCNSGAGHKFEAAWTASKRIEEFARGRPTAFKAAIEIGGVVQRVNVQTNADGVVVVGVPKAGPLATPDQIIGALEDQIDRHEPLTFRLTHEDRFEPKSIQLAVLRAAYLTSVYRLGFRYALDENLDPVRKQLATPDADVLRLPVVLDPGAVSASPTLMLVRDPVDLRSVVVSIGGHNTFLPPTTDTATVFYTDIVHALSEHFDGSTVDMSGITVTDDAPPFLLDHHPDAFATLADA